MKCLFLPIHDPGLCQVVWADLDEDVVAGQDADVVPAHSPGDVPDELMLLLAYLDFQAEHRVRQCLKDERFGFYVFCLSHVLFFATAGGL